MTKINDHARMSSSKAFKCNIRASFIRINLIKIINVLKASKNGKNQKLRKC